MPFDNMLLPAAATLDDVEGRVMKAMLREDGAAWFTVGHFDDGRTVDCGRTMWTLTDEGMQERDRRVAAEMAPAVPDPTLADLSAILRDRTRWPVGFKWDYTKPPFCAMGLANRIRAGWFSAIATSMDSAGFHAECDAIFVDAEIAIGKAYADVTPEDVADAIDAYLARTEG